MLAKVSQGGKKPALTMVGKVYQKATYVLVLDSCLLNWEFKHLSNLETLTRIFCSKWMRRLWTLQEGILESNDEDTLADRLWFQFKGATVPLKWIWGSTLISLGDDITLDPLTADLFKQFRGLVGFHGEEQDQSITLMAVHNALRYRLTSVPWDEALIISFLLRWDVQKILDIPKEQRMQTVWSQLAANSTAIPRNIIFNPGKRLSESGFRWAPSTLMGPSNSEMPISTDGPPGILTSSGLTVQYPGSILSSRSPPRGPVVEDLYLLQSLQ